MGENLAVDGRLSVRTPMQWTDEASAGFSTAAPGALRRPIPDGRFGPLAVNVADQRRDPDSLLSWTERVIRRRRETPELGWGDRTLLETSHQAVLAHRCDWGERSVLAIHNLGAPPLEVSVAVGCPPESRLVDLLDDAAPAHEVGGEHIELKLPGYGYRWYRVQAQGQPAAP